MTVDSLGYLTCLPPYLPPGPPPYLSRQLSNEGSHYVKPLLLLTQLLGGASQHRADAPAPRMTERTAGSPRQRGQTTTSFIPPQEAGGDPAARSPGKEHLSNAETSRKAVWSRVRVPPGTAARSQSAGQRGWEHSGGLPDVIATGSAI